MHQTVTHLGGQARGRERRVFIAYEEAAGEMLRRLATPDVLRGTTLFLRVGSSPLAHEVTLLRRELLDRLALKLGPDVVTDIRTRVDHGAGAPSAARNSRT